MRALLNIMLFTLATTASAQTQLSLPALEAQLDAAPEVLIAVAQMQESLYLLQRERARRGLKLFGSAGYSDVSEAVTDSIQRSYRRATVTVGLSYPLLGSKRQEDLAILQARKTVQQRNYEEQLARRTALTSLRKHYIDYWSAQRRLVISDAFLGNESETRSWLAERTQAGFLLEADRREFLTTFDLVRRNLATDQLIVDRSLDTMGMLTRASLSQFEAGVPEMPSVCLDRDELQADVLNKHPEIESLRQAMDLRARYADYRSPINASLNLSASSSEDFPSGLPGDSVALSFNLNMPLNWRQSSRAVASADAAAARVAQYRLDQRSQQLIRQVDDALGRFGIAVEQLNFSEQRVSASLEAVRERRLRAEALSGDVQEQLQQSRFNYYLTALELNDAESQLLRAKADLLALSDKQCGPESGLKVVPRDVWLEDESRARKTSLIDASRHPSIPLTSSTRGIYVWDSAAILTAGHDLTQIAESGFNRILMSLDANQIRALKTRSGWRKLETWLNDARGSGIRVDLLLGEPTWMMPDSRPELLNIISELRHLPFGGLHLDLEPGMLDEKPSAQVRKELYFTVQAAIQLSPWPVSMSLHYRDLLDTDNYCLGCTLGALDLEDISLMIYVRNPRRVVEISEPIRREFPDLPLSIAQSVERTLAAEESHASGNLEQLELRLNDLQTFVESQHMNGLLIQSWLEYKEMPE